MYPIKCKGRKGWDKAGQHGLCYSEVYINKMWWAVVLWDSDEDPSLYKSSGLNLEDAK